MSPKRIPTALPDRTMPLTVLAAVRGIIAPAGCSTIEYGKRKGFYGSKQRGCSPVFRPYSPKSLPLLPPHWQEQAAATAATFPAMQSVRNPLHRALPSLVRTARSALR